MYRIPSKTIIKNMFRVLFLAAIITAALSTGRYSGTDGIIARITGTGTVEAAIAEVTNVEASDVTFTGAILNGVLEDTGGEYVTTNSYGNTVSSTPQAPASVTITNFNVTPSKAQAGDTVNISVTYTNTGVSPYTYPVVIKVNGVSEYAEEVSLAPGESRLVTCGITEGKSGIYEVNVNGSSNSFIVQESHGSTDESGWLLIAGIFGGTLVAGFSILFIFRRPMIEVSY